jgi:electron transfer flavoprotein alpha subunit
MGRSILTPMSGADEGPQRLFDRALRIAVLVKQIPVGEAMVLGDNRRLVREGLELEMNAYCRRAVSKGVEWAGASGGTCSVFTLGPPSAEDVLREAIAWGADEGIHLCDDEFGGSDTLATASALSAALRMAGPFDLILVGRNSLDGDTGQVGPEVAQLCELPFAAGVRVMGADGPVLSLTLQHDDGWEEVEVALPALLSVAERLCEPCKVPPDGRAEVSPDRIRRVSAHDLGPGPWGEAASPTRVGATRRPDHSRAGKVLAGSVENQVAEAVSLLSERGALTPLVADRSEEPGPPEGRPPPRDGRVIAVLIEPDREQVGRELLGAAARLAVTIGGRVHALAVDGDAVESLGTWGANGVTNFIGSPVPEDVAAAAVEWSGVHRPWAVLGPSTAFGREILSRMAAALGAGLVGDAIGLEVVDGELVAAKPAFSGALVADITCTSDTRLVSIRPGVLPALPTRSGDCEVAVWPVTPRGRLRILSKGRDDDIEVLARAEVVVGVGAAVPPGEYHLLSALTETLGAALAATRKVTDNGWAPRARQVGITGRSIAPRLYVAIGVAGKFNHLVGVRAAGTILAVNRDPDAVIFSHCDVGIVGDWHDVLPVLTRAIRHEREGAGAPGEVG